MPAATARAAEETTRQVRNGSPSGAGVIMRSATLDGFRLQEELLPKPEV
jgi:hypothetical protein